MGGRYEELQLPVGSSQVDAKAANLGGQQKHKDVIIAVEVIHQPRAYPNVCGTIHPVIPGNQNKLQPSGANTGTLWHLTAIPTPLQLRPLTHELSAFSSCFLSVLRFVDEDIDAFKLGPCKPVVCGLHSPLHDVQHLLRLREHQRLVPLLAPVRQHLHTMSLFLFKGNVWAPDMMLRVLGTQMVRSRATRARKVSEGVAFMAPVRRVLQNGPPYS